MKKEPELPKVMFGEEAPELVEKEDENIAIDKIQKTPLGTFYSRIKTKPKPKLTPLSLTITSSVPSFNNTSWFHNFNYVEETTKKYTRDEMKARGAEALAVPYTKARGKNLFSDEKWPDNFFVDCLKCGHHIIKLHDFFDHGIIEHGIDSKEVLKMYVKLVDQIYDKGL